MPKLLLRFTTWPLVTDYYCGTTLDDYTKSTNYRNQKQIFNLSRNNQFQHKTKPRDYRLSMQSESIGQCKQLPVSLSQKAQNRYSDQC